ncbi:MAG: hypothetical protein QF733_06885 [Phycisphaerales bacterium]|jgi:hypothetical protein|nr:hypothetical protein [Phycisphaerales bacterium]
MSLPDRLATMPLSGDWLHGRVTLAAQTIELLDDHATTQPPPGSRADLSVQWSGGRGADPFQEDPRTWLPGSWESLKAATFNAPALLRPHACHVVSDGLSCARLVTEGGRLALSPASMVHASMKADADDHLIRIFEMAGPHASLLILEDLQRDGIHGASAGRGCLPGSLLGHLINRHLPPQVPVIVAADEPAEAMAWLGQR